MTDVQPQEDTLVNNPDTQEVIPTTPEPSEPVKDYEAEARNKAIALKERDKKLAEAEARLAEYQAKEKELAEKELKKKGKYEELLTEKENELSEFRARREAHEPLIEQFTQRQQKELETLKSSIPDSEKEWVEKLIDGKDHATQIEILEKMTKQLGSYDGRNTPSQKTPTGFSPMSIESFQKMNTDEKKAYMDISKKEKGEVIFI